MLSAEERAEQFEKLREESVAGFNALDVFADRYGWLKVVWWVGQYAGETEALYSL